MWKPRAHQGSERLYRPLVHPSVMQMKGGGHTTRVYTRDTMKGYIGRGSGRERDGEEREKKERKRRKNVKRVDVVRFWKNTRSISRSVQTRSSPMFSRFISFFFFYWTTTTTTTNARVWDRLHRRWKSRGLFVWLGEFTISLFWFKSRRTDYLKRHHSSISSEYHIYL